MDRGLCLDFEGHPAFSQKISFEEDKACCKAGEPFHMARFRRMPLPTQLHIEMHTSAVAEVRKVHTEDKGDMGLADNPCTGEFVPYFAPAVGERCTDTDSLGADRDLVAQKEVVEVEETTADA